MENKLIILIEVILGTIAISQLVRVYELSSKLRKTGENEVSNRDNVLNARMMLIFMIFQFLGLIYLMIKYGWTGRGVAASNEGVETDWLLNLNFVIILIIFFFTNFLLFYFSFKFEWFLSELRCCQIRFGMLKTLFHRPEFENKVQIENIEQRGGDR